MTKFEWILILATLIWLAINAHGSHTLMTWYKQENKWKTNVEKRIKKLQKEVRK